MKRRYRNKNWVMTVLFVLIGLLFILKPVEANSESNLPSGIVAGDDQGIKIKNDGQYLIDFRDVEPGKNGSQKSQSST